MLSPLIKWTGSKRHVAQFLSTRFPEFDRFIVPFVGGGCILEYVTTEVVASDIVPQLIAVFDEVKSSPATLLSEYQKRHQAFAADPTFYYQVRDAFNSTKNFHDFYFLTRTCYNGLIRFNKKGGFNSPVQVQGDRKGIKPENLTHVLKQWQNILQKASFFCEDYFTTFSRVRSGDFVFLDPPYLGTKGQYYSQSFDYPTFFKYLDALSDKNIKWMLCLDHNLLDLEVVLPHSVRHIFHTPLQTSPFAKLKGRVRRAKDTVCVNYKLEKND